MKSINHLPESERKHFVKCDKCGEWIDCRDLGQVFEHEHAELTKPKWDSAIRKGEPTEYPNPKKNLDSFDLNRNRFSFLNPLLQKLFVL